MVCFVLFVVKSGSCDLQCAGKIVNGNKNAKQSKTQNVKNLTLREGIKTGKKKIGERGRGKGKTDAYKGNVSLN